MPRNPEHPKLEFSDFIAQSDSLRREQAELLETSEALGVVSLNIRTPALIRLSAGAFIPGELVHTSEVLCPPVPGSSEPPVWLTTAQAQGRIASHVAALDARINGLAESYIAAVPPAVARAQLEAATDELVPFARATFRSVPEKVTAAGSVRKAVSGASQQAGVSMPPTVSMHPAAAVLSSDGAPKIAPADAANPAAAPAALEVPGVRDVEIGGEVFSEIVESFDESCLSDRERRLLQRRHLRQQQQAPKADSSSHSVPVAPPGPEPLPSKVDPRAPETVGVGAHMQGQAAVIQREPSTGVYERALPSPRADVAENATSAPSARPAFASTIVERFPRQDASALPLPSVSRSPVSAGATTPASAASDAAPVSRFRQLRQQQARG